MVHCRLRHLRRGGSRRSLLACSRAWGSPSVQGALVAVGIMIGRGDGPHEPTSSAGPVALATTSTTAVRATTSIAASTTVPTPEAAATSASSTATPAASSDKATSVAPVTTSPRQSLDELAENMNATDSSRVAETPDGPFGAILSDGVTELYHYRNGGWEPVGQFESPTGVDAKRIDTLDVTQDNISDFVITMDGPNAMRPIGGVLVMRSDGGWYWADFQDPVEASYAPVRDGLEVVDGALLSNERSCIPRLPRLVEQSRTTGTSSTPNSGPSS